LNARLPSPDRRHERIIGTKATRNPTVQPVTAMRMSHRTGSTRSTLSNPKVTYCTSRPSDITVPAANPSPGWE